MDGIARIVNACLMALRPVLHAAWRGKCSEIGILADECWITSFGAEIIDILRAVDFDAKSQPRPLCPIGLKRMILRPCTRIYQMRLFKKSCVSY